MLSPEPFLLFTRTLNKLGIRHMVSGSVAAIYYGEPRLTNDVDIIVFMRQEDAATLANAFPEAEFYCPPLEVILTERLRVQRGHFNLLHHATGFKADIYLARKDPLHLWGIDHAVNAEIDGETVVFAPPEYVILRKLQFFREGGSQKHLRDIQRMLTGLGEEWDRKDLLLRVGELGLQTEYQRALEWQD